MAAETGRADLHVHLASAAGLADAAAAGVVYLRDAGTRDGIGLTLRGSASPRIVTAGWALYKGGGYGGRFGVPVDSPADIRREVRRLKDAGAGIIKVMASGMVSLSQRGIITAGGFDRQELELIVAEATAFGIKVMAHANGAAAIEAACEAGAASIEHGFFMTDEALECVARKQVLWVPTVGALMRAAEAPNAPAGAKEAAQEAIDHHLVMIGKAYRLGVRLGIGTDCTLPDPKYRAAYEAELEWFMRAGIPVKDVQIVSRKPESI